MATDLYDLSVPAFRRGLRALDSLLDTAVGHAEATGADAEAWLDARLAPDMHPLRKQIQIACDSPKLCVSRLSGVAGPVHDDSEVSIADLKARIAQTVDYIASVPREAIDGQEEREVVLPLPKGEMRFRGLGYLTGFALPNFYFHLTMAYGLLRQAGVPIGKRDYLGSPG